MEDSVRLIHGDCLEVLRTLPDGAARCCVTSPPYYGLRDYGTPGQLGLEPTLDEYVAQLVAVFREVRRVLTDNGTLWLNLGDSYGGTRGNSTPAPDNKHAHAQADTPGHGKGDTLRKQLLGIPWRVAFALQADGWYLRSDIIWHKPNAMPESVRDRPTKAHEYLFLLAKSERYFYDADAVREAQTTLTNRSGSGKFDGDATMKARALTTGEINPLGRNRRTVWPVPTKPYSGAHFAVMPEALVEPCILAGSAAGDTILDPFCGSGTVGAVATRTGRDFIGVDLNADYLSLAERRIAAAQPPLFAAAD
jgi:DNA modification methylase